MGVVRLMSHLSVVYYTASREPVVFEQRIHDYLRCMSNNACPIISVSQKPIDLGTNICIGEQEHGEGSRLQQLWIGLQYCTTPYVAMAESDFLYPPDYFTFVPPKHDCLYEYGPLYLLYTWVDWRTCNQFWLKNRSEGARIGHIQYIFDELEHLMLRYDPTCEPKDWPIIRAWRESHPEIAIRTRSETPFVYRVERYERNPVVSIRTRYGMSNPYKATPAGHGIDAIPFWGAAADLRQVMIEGVPEFVGQ